MTKWTSIVSQKIVNFHYVFPKQPNKDFYFILFYGTNGESITRFKLWLFLHPSVHRSQSLPLLTLTCPFLFYVLKGITYYQAKIIKRDLCGGALWVSTLMSSISSLETTKWSLLVFQTRFNLHSFFSLCSQTRFNLYFSLHPSVLSNQSLSSPHSRMPTLCTGNHTYHQEKIITWIFAVVPLAKCT